MKESHSSPNLGPSHRSSSIRLRKRRDEVKQQFVKNRRSGDFGYRLGRDAVDNTDNTDDVLTNSKVDTLDAGSAAGSIQHNLRPLLRSKYKHSPMSDTEEYLGSVWGRRGRDRGDGGGGVKIKHFGLIDMPPMMESESCLSDQFDRR